MFLTNNKLLVLSYFLAFLTLLCLISTFALHLLCTFSCRCDHFLFTSFGFITFSLLPFKKLN